MHREGSICPEKSCKENKENMKTYIIGFMLFLSITGMAMAAEAGSVVVAIAAALAGAVALMIYERRNEDA